MKLDFTFCPPNPLNYKKGNVFFSFLNFFFFPCLNFFLFSLISLIPLFLSFSYSVWSQGDFLNCFIMRMKKRLKLHPCGIHEPTPLSEHHPQAVPTSPFQSARHPSPNPKPVSNPRSTYFSRHLACFLFINRTLHTTPFLCLLSRQLPLPTHITHPSSPTHPHCPLTLHLTNIPDSAFPNPTSFSHFPPPTPSRLARVISPLPSFLNLTSFVLKIFGFFLPSLG